MFGPAVNFGAVPRPAFGRAAQHVAQTPHKSKAEARYQRAAKTAAELLPDLPQPGESIHARLDGHFDLTQVLVSVARRLDRLTDLHVTSLCFNKRNAADFLALLEDRPGLRFTLLVSKFFQAHNKDLYEHAQEQLRDYPGTRIHAARNHAKVTLYASASGHYVFESSANLRSNRCTEILTAFNDPALYSWHRSWIETLANADEGKPK